MKAWLKIAHFNSRNLLQKSIPSVGLVLDWYLKLEDAKRYRLIDDWNQQY